MKQILPTQVNPCLPPEKIGEWDQLAYQLAGHEEWDQAANSLQKAADADPGQVKRWLTIAAWRQRCGQFSKAISVLAHALNLDQKESALISAKGTCHWSANEQVLLLSELAHLYAQDSRWTECEEVCMKVLELQSDHLAMTELMATACLQTGHLDAAGHLLESLLRRAPLDPWFRLRYASLLQMQGKLGSAQQELLLLDAMDLAPPIAAEVKTAVEYLDHLQFQQTVVLLESNVELRTALAHDPRGQLEILGFRLTDAALEMLQNMLWEHFGKSPFESLDYPSAPSRLH